MALAVETRPESTLSLDEIQSGLEMVGAIDEIVHRHNEQRGSAIPILQEIQARFGYVPPAVLERVAELINVPASDLYSIATFYAQFRLQPLGENLIRVCHGTACHLAGADKIAEALRLEAGAAEGETSADGMFTVERVACLGCCSLGPVAMVNDEVHGRLTPEGVRAVVKKTREGCACKGKQADADKETIPCRN